MALLLRSGALAAPMDIIEERTVGPSLGAENISRGFNSTLYGFLAVAIFVAAYYAAFGVISVIALALNLLLLVGLLSIMQATLTLPGMAALALTVGMAIDANVLINERIRDELRTGASPQQAIQSGYERALGTILDSNITTLIAGIALFAFGSGPVKGFAVVLCLGILTSVFTATFVSRGIVNLMYGNRRLDTVPIGKIWLPKGNDKVPDTFDASDEQPIEPKRRELAVANEPEAIIEQSVDQVVVSNDTPHSQGEIAVETATIKPDSIARNTSASRSKGKNKRKKSPNVT